MLEQTKYFRKLCELEYDFTHNFSYFSKFIKDEEDKKYIYRRFMDIEDKILELYSKSVEGLKLDSIYDEDDEDI